MHKKVAYLYSVIFDSDKIILSKENNVRCWSCHFFNNKQTTEILSAIRNKNALYTLCESCTNDETRIKIMAHDSESTGLYKCKPETLSNHVIMINNTDATSISLNYQGKELIKEKFINLDKSVKNGIAILMHEHNYSILDLL